MSQRRPLYPRHRELRSRVISVSYLCVSGIDLFANRAISLTPCRCRNCTSFAAWAAQTKDTLKHDAARTQTATQGPPADCPPDVETLGRSTWTLLHSIAAQYPEQPSRGQQSDLLSFVGLFSKLYPCWVCAEDFQGYLHRDAPKVGSRDQFGKWLCGAHNEVNRKLGKAEFDCSKWEERWRTGWKDGRCD